MSEREKRQRLLIIDDEENMCHMLKVMLERHGYAVQTETSGERALSLVTRQAFSFVLCDVRMPGMDGLSFIRAAADALRDCPVIMMSAYGSVESAIEAMKVGAYDFISKPFKADEVLLALKKAEEREQLRHENRSLKKKLAELSGNEGFAGMIAGTKVMQELFLLAQNVAQYDTTVLITGESGTGKELIARGIHEHSPRRGRPFVAVNCGSLPEHLLESELFGHVRGAFTGADRSTSGLFRAADGSTIFLDEIAELPLAMQVKLLRVLQEQEVRPLGATRPEPVDVRVLAATSKDMPALVADGRFREDLFYRLNVVHVKLPPLRERKDDIPLLCHHFVKKFNKRFDKAVVGPSSDAMLLLLRHDWPGNVRELENVIQRGLVLSSGDAIEVEDLPRVVNLERKRLHSHSLIDALALDGFSLKNAQQRLESLLIKCALAESGGNKSRAARMLEMSYPSLLHKIKEYRITLDDPGGTREGR